MYHYLLKTHLVDRCYLVNPLCDSALSISSLLPHLFSRPLPFSFLLFVHFFLSTSLPPSSLSSPPPDLSVIPSAPRNVSFGVLSNTDSTRPEVILQAWWVVQDCEAEIQCVEVLGYIIICEDREGNEIRHTVWRTDVEEFAGSIASVNFSVRPFSEYQCLMMAFNSFGIGLAGSRFNIVTDQIGKWLHGLMHVRARE